MPLLFGDPSRGGLGGIKGKFNQARLGNRRNKFQDQIKRNPGFGKATFNRPPPEQEGGPKLATPLTQPEGEGSEVDRIGEAVRGRGARSFGEQGPPREGFNPLSKLMEMLSGRGGIGGRLNPGDVAGFEQEGGGFTGRRSEAIPMMGMPGAAGGVDFSRIAQFLPDNIKRMMGV